MAQQLDAFPKPRATRKDAGKPRPKKYPTRFGRGTVHVFSDSRVMIHFGGRRFLRRLHLMWAVLTGRMVRIDATNLLLIQAQGSVHAHNPAYTLRENDGSDVAATFFGGTGY